MPSVRPGGAAEALVVRTLMRVEPLADGFVLRLARLAFGTAVVAEREERRGAGLATTPGERFDPIGRHEIEQRGGRDQVPSGEQILAQRPQLHRPRVDATLDGPRRQPSQPFIEQRGVAIDGEPLLRTTQPRRQIADVRAGAAPEIDDPQRRRERQPLDEEIGQLARSRGGIRRLAKRQPRGERFTHAPARGRGRPPSSRRRHPNPQDVRAHVARRRPAVPAAWHRS